MFLSYSKESIIKAGHSNFSIKANEGGFLSPKHRWLDNSAYRLTMACPTVLISISAHVKNHNADYAVRGVTSTSLLDMRGLTIMKTYDRSNRFLDSEINMHAEKIHKWYLIERTLSRISLQV
ncbi:hypothetical protein OUZ56_004199 [Daphnia magna]|uniref:Uncharacterized protein n=1 Tax=Daphnia magna TaxID=35525 RepID=A0ABQ9YPE8_9CRUS|nr:hypothetical protein OUZ56_004199 [Daphnia magna]